MSKQEGRVLLPDNVEPQRYELKITPDLNSFVFDGEVNIGVKVKQTTKTITLHAKELYLKTVVFIPEGGEQIKAEQIGFNLKLTTVTFTFESEIPIGDGTLQIEFTGHINDQMAGFYRSQYKSISGEKKFMASTQFESLDARRCFPCWDEPARKAIFSVTFVIPQQLQVISNMPEKSSNVLQNGKREVKFLDSPLMSTYLLAFCVGEFDFAQGYTKHGVVIKVYTPPGKGDQASFALNVAKKTLDLYDDFFGLPYPLPKLDMIAITEFAMGAMENWGLVTYREVDLLIDSEKASSQQKQRVCTVVTHELAHQWFGNLVTMQWWDDLWLNEGFASWMQTYAADILFPDWCMWEQFTTDDLAGALRLDALRTSHPIQVPIAHAEEVEEVFDAISYSKGACVVSMAHAILGPEDFRKGLVQYMEKHKYSNTETYDLWNAWGEASGKPMASIMASWTEQMGFPVISVLEEKWSETSVVLKLQQKWFLADGSDTTAEGKLWTVPLLIGTPHTSQTPTLKLTSEATFSVTVNLQSPNDWVLLNAGQHVPLRVVHSPTMIQRLVPAIKSKSLSSSDRAGLVLDAYALMKAGYMDFASLVPLLDSYRNEDNAVTWEALEMVLRGLNRLLQSNQEVYPKFTRFVSDLIRPTAAKIGWHPKESDGHLGKLLRGSMIRLLAVFSSSEESVISEARSLYKKLIEDPNGSHIPSDFRVPVFKMVLAAGGQEEYNKIKELFTIWDNSNVDQKAVMTSIGATPLVELKKQTLEWAISGSIKRQDFFYPFSGVSDSGIKGLEISWNFFKQNFDKIQSYISTASPSLMDAVISYSCSGFCTNEKADDITNFFESHPLPLSKRTISQIIEDIRVNAKVLERLEKSGFARALQENSLSQ